LRGDRDTITHKDMMEAYDRITIGAVSREQYTKKSLLETAYHEAGHAILTYLVHPTNEVIKATIKPRKGYLGYIWNRPIEELKTGAPNKEHLMSDLQVGLAGYAAEKVAFGTSSSGVGGDFDRAMNIATMMVWNMGMGANGLIGDFEAINANQISEKTKEKLDEDIQEILQSCLKTSLDILQDKKELLEFFAQELLEKGDLEYNEVQDIFNKFKLQPASRPKAS